MSSLHYQIFTNGFNELSSFYWIKLLVVFTVCLIFWRRPLKVARKPHPFWTVFSHTPTVLVCIRLFLTHAFHGEWKITKEWRYKKRSWILKKNFIDSSKEKSKINLSWKSRLNKSHFFLECLTPPLIQASLVTVVSRGDWLGSAANIKVENNGVVGYVRSFLTVHNPLHSVHKLWLNKLMQCFYRSITSKC